MPARKSSAERTKKASRSGRLKNVNPLWNPKPIPKLAPAIIKGETIQDDSPCEVVSCLGAPPKEMMFYDGKRICIQHFSKLCSERDLQGGKLEFNQLFDLRPARSKVKTPHKRDQSADAGSPWAIAKQSLIGVFNNTPGPYSVKALFELLTAGGWTPPGSNNDPVGTLHDIVNKLVKEGLVTKVSRGQYGPCSAN